MTVGCGAERKHQGDESMPFCLVQIWTMWLKSECFASRVARHPYTWKSHSFTDWIVLEVRAKLVASTLLSLMGVITKIHQSMESCIVEEM